jgi:protein gp37
MADNSRIEWTEATWNPVTGCTKVSPGCDHCYAERVTERFSGKGSFEKIVFHGGRLDQPLRWTRPRRIFVNSMSDLFHDDVPDEFIARVFAVMGLAARHTFQLLTKRHGRLRSLLNRPDFREAIAEHGSDLIGAKPWRRGQVQVGQWTPTACEPKKVGVFTLGDTLWSPPWPLPNVWVGVSVEDQKWADIRIPALLETPAAVRWLSCEPLLGPLDLSRWLGPVDFPPCWDDHAPSTECAKCIQPQWVVVGGESGPGARPMHPDWARQLRDQCETAKVPFFFKQWGESLPLVGHREYLDLPPARTNRDWDRPFGDEVTMCRVGKKAAGRELDGRTWDEYPQGVTV